MRYNAVDTNGRLTILNNGSQEVCFKLEGPKIGDHLFGGIIFYILVSGDTSYDPNVPHYFISSTNDLSASWGCTGTYLGSIGYLLGNGVTNTTTIITNCTTPGIAAKLCYDLIQDGYSDWFLPSKDELNKMYLAKQYLGLSSAYYWSSSEDAFSHDPDYVFVQLMSDGDVSQAYKADSRPFRPIRYF